MAEIRCAIAEDVPFLPDIERSSGQLFRSLPDLAWITDHDVQSEARHAELIGKGTAWVALSETGALTGFLSGEIVGGYLHIWELAVRHEEQGKGAGRALIERARQFAAEHQMPGMTLTTFREVPWNEPFYRRLGFETLEAEQLSSDLEAILALEIDAGLPAERRCAMRLSLHP